MRPQWKFVWSFLALLCTLMPAPARAAGGSILRRAGNRSGELRPDDPRASEDRHGAAERLVGRLDLGNAVDDLADLNGSSTWAAERARSLDPHNLLAHGLLARQYVVTGQDARAADGEWATVLDNGGAVVWTATLYDVDAKSYFLLAFDRNQLRIYRYGELAGRFATHMGMPQFVDEGTTGSGGRGPAASIRRRSPRRRSPGATSTRSRRATGCSTSS
jgi:hypothetical protein